MEQQLDLFSKLCRLCESTTFEHVVAELFENSDPRLYTTRWGLGSSNVN